MSVAIVVSVLTISALSLAMLPAFDVQRPQLERVRVRKRPSHPDPRDR